MAALRPKILDPPRPNRAIALKSISFSSPNFNDIDATMRTTRPTFKFAQSKFLFTRSHRNKMLSMFFFFVTLTTQSIYSIELDIIIYVICFVWFSSSVVANALFRKNNRNSHSFSLAKLANSTTRQKSTMLNENRFGYERTKCSDDRMSRGTNNIHHTSLVFHLGIFMERRCRWNEYVHDAQQKAHSARRRTTSTTNETINGNWIFCTQERAYAFPPWKWARAFRSLHFYR